MVIGITHLGLPVITDAHMARTVLMARMLDYRIDQLHLAHIILKGLDDGRGGTDFSSQKGVPLQDWSVMEYTLSIRMRRSSRPAVRLSQDMGDIKLFVSPDRV